MQQNPLDTRLSGDCCTPCNRVVMCSCSPVLRGIARKGGLCWGLMGPPLRRKMKVEQYGFDFASTGPPLEAPKAKVVKCSVALFNNRADLPKEQFQRFAVAMEAGNHRCIHFLAADFVEVYEVACLL